MDVLSQSMRLFRRWLLAPPRSLGGMRMSKLEQAVQRGLVAALEHAPTRELKLCIQVPFALRKYINGNCRSGLAPTLFRQQALMLRFDFAWIHRDGTLMLVEVDGGQHVRRKSIFHKSTESFQARARRDSIKNLLIRMVFPRARLLRFGPLVRNRSSQWIKNEVLRWLYQSHHCMQLCAYSPLFPLHDSLQDSRRRKALVQAMRACKSRRIWSRDTLDVYSPPYRVVQMAKDS